MQTAFTSLVDLSKYYLKIIQIYFEFANVLVTQLGQNNEINGKYFIKTVQDGRLLLFDVNAD